MLRRGFIGLSLLAAATTAISIKDMATKAWAEPAEDDAAKPADADGGKFGFRKVLLTDGAPDGYGMYTQRASNVFKDGDKIYVYMEPVGLHWTSQDGLYQSAATLDYELRTADGKILAGKRGFGNMTFKSHEQNKEVMYKVDLRFTGAPKGKYVLALTAHEAGTDKSASVELPIEYQ